MGNFPWGPKPIDRLRALIDDERSSGAAARILSAEFRHPLSRSAVMGKSAALGLHFKSTNRNGRSTKSVALKPLNEPATVTAPKPASHPQSGRTSEKRQVEQVASVTATVAAAPAPIAPVLTAVTEINPARPDVIAIPVSERVTLSNLREGMCRWPIGDPRAEDFRFCGARAPGQGPYCGYHAQIAYEPAQDRRRSRDQAKRARAI